MSREDEDEDGVSIFEEGELILVTLVNGDHRIGEFMFESDAGICMKVTSKTVLIEELNIDEEKYALGKKRTLTVLRGRTLPELTKLADKHKISVKEVFGELQYPVHASEAEVVEMYAQALLKYLMTEWEKDNRITKKAMKDLRIAIRTYIPWDKVEQIEAAEEVHEEYELRSFEAEANGLGSGEVISDEKWNTIIEEWKNNDN